MSGLSKADYLKRYLSKDSNVGDEEKKKKAKKKSKKNPAKVSKMRIIDSDLFVGGNASEEESEEDDYDKETATRLGRSEELPSVAGVVDSRPMDVIIKEKLSTGEWKPLGGWTKENAPVGILAEAKDYISNEKKLGRAPRRKRHDSSSSDGSSPPRRKRHDSSASDPSPPRRSSNITKDISTNIKKEPIKEEPEDSDASPPRYRLEDRRIKTEPRIKDEPRDSDESPPRSSEELMKKTLDGKKAGLQDAKTLKREMKDIRAKEKESFSKMRDDISGRGAETKIRGRLKEKEERKRQKKKENEITDEIKEKYSRWSKGLKQLENREEKIKEDLHEMSKPLTRSKDDVDLDEHLRNAVRAEDPMLKYIQKKTVQKEEKNGKLQYPRYQGPTPAPNRFQVYPGYRWDGVDRSNGFEKQLFEAINSRKAVSEEAHKWSTEDM